MAVERLADELLGMILKPSLAISRNQLVSSSVTTFGKNDMVSSASVLLVCKRWLRVATPLLYENAIIRSTGQSRALAAVFSQNPEFASHVKNVRLEGAYASLMVVLQPCTNLVTLVLLLNIYSDTNVTGLCRVLRLINPVEFILRDMEDKDNAKIRSVLVALCEAIPQWKALTSFEYPYGKNTGLDPLDHASQTSRRDGLIDALTKSKSLKVFFSSFAQLEADQWRNLARNSSVTFQFYHCFRSTEELMQVACKNMDSVPSIASRVEFMGNPEYTETQEPAPRCNNRFISKLQKFYFQAINDEIWSSILVFAAMPDLPLHYLNIFSVWQALYGVSTTRKAISLTCKRFERLVRPSFLAVPMISSRSSLKAFTDKIVAQPHLGRLVHTLFLTSWEPITGIIELLLKLIPHLTFLHHFYGGGLYGYNLSKVFDCLAAAAGDTLLTISGVEDVFTQSSPIPMFSSFNVLKALELPHVGVISDLGSRLPASQPFVYLSCLEVPAYGNVWSTVCKFRFPALKSVSLFGADKLLQTTNFLRKSGSTIEHMRVIGFADFGEVFSLVPNLLSINWEPRVHEKNYLSLTQESLNPSAAHAKLEIFTIQGVFGYNSTAKRNNNLLPMIFGKLVLQGFPSLKEIRFPAYEWPVDERSVSRHPLPKKAIEVKQSYNIDIVDKSGKPWRIRTQGRG